MTQSDIKLLYGYPFIFDNPAYLSHINAWHGHIPFAFWCIYALRPNIFVELGTHYGDSYFAFCQAMQKVNMMPHYPNDEYIHNAHAVDTWQGDKHAGFYGSEVIDKVVEVNSQYYPFSTLHKETFAEAVSNFQDKSIDLLHIDGYHTYKDTKETFEMYLPKLSDKAVVLFHDTNVDNPDFGVSQFVDELKYQRYDFLHCNGLSVLCVGKDIPKPLDILLNASGMEKARFRAVFQALGYIITM